MCKDLTIRHADVAWLLIALPETSSGTRHKQTHPSVSLDSFVPSRLAVHQACCFILTVKSKLVCSDPSVLLQRLHVHHCHKFLVLWRQPISGHVCTFAAKQSTAGLFTTCASQKIVTLLFVILLQQRRTCSPGVSKQVSKAVDQACDLHPFLVRVGESAQLRCLVGMLQQWHLNISTTGPAEQGCLALMHC